MKTAPISTKLWAIVPAAGSGSRFSKTDLKQYQKINDVTVLQHSVNRLLTIDNLQGCVVVTHPDDTFIHTLTFNQQEKIRLCHGGHERVNSVLNGLNFLLTVVGANEHDYVLVHDAARPCIHSSSLQMLVSCALKEQTGAILATPVRDTLKQVINAPHITTTIDRTALWQAQTPQIAPIGVLKNAIELALTQKITITDEASALEYVGYQVNVVQGRSDNLKITYPDDLHLASLILHSQAH